MTNPAIQELRAGAKPALKNHFLALSPEDRRLRFGMVVSDPAIERYVEGIDFARDDVFSVVDHSLDLVAVAHVAFLDDSAELGVSVLPEYRREGIGTALLVRARERARNRFVSKFFVHCLAENEAMLNVARKAGMKVVVEYGDADAMLELPPGDTASLTEEMMQQQVALFDYALKAQLLAFRRINDSLLGERRVGEANCQSIEAVEC